MLFQVTSAKPLSEIDQALRAAAANNKFGVLAVHNLQETMRNKGVEFDKEVLVYEVCNPHQAKKVLDANLAISTALPCRISVYSAPGGYSIATILPTALIAMFGDASLAPAAQEVEQSLKAIMRAAV